MWAGSDDGLINITRDEGKSWQNITPKKTFDITTCPEYHTGRCNRNFSKNTDIVI